MGKCATELCIVIRHALTGLIHTLRPAGAIAVVLVIILLIASAVTPAGILAVSTSGTYATAFAAGPDKFHLCIIPASLSTGSDVCPITNMHAAECHAKCTADRGKTAEYVS